MFGILAKFFRFSGKENGNKFKLSMVKRVAEKNISPDEKLLEMIYTRLDSTRV